jgi:hypothetical protein
MGKKNVVFTKDGIKVGVKDIQNERYVDKTQSWVVKAWKLSQPNPDDGLYVNTASSPREMDAPQRKHLLTHLLDADWPHRQQRKK